VKADWCGDPAEQRRYKAGWQVRAPQPPPPPCCEACRNVVVKIQDRFPKDTINFGCGLHSFATRKGSVCNDFNAASTPVSTTPNGGQNR